MATRRHQVDYLIVGAHSHSVWRQRLGGVSAAVVTQGPRPVTVVRAAREP